MRSPGREDSFLVTTSCIYPEKRCFLVSREWHHFYWKGLQKVRCEASRLCNIKIEDWNPKRLKIIDSKEESVVVFSKVGDLLDVIQKTKEFPWLNKFGKCIAIHPATQDCNPSASDRLISYCQLHSVPWACSFHVFSPLVYLLISSLKTYILPLSYILFTKIQILLL